VEQFQTHGRALRHLRHLTEILGHEQYQHRPHALSGPLPDVLKHLPEQSVGVRQRVVEKIDKGIQF